MKRFLKRGISLLVVLMLLVTAIPAVLAAPPGGMPGGAPAGDMPGGPGGDMPWEDMAGLGNAAAEQKAESWTKKTVENVTAITNVVTRENWKSKNAYVVGADVTTDSGTQTLEGLITVIGKDGKEIAPTVTGDSESGWTASYDLTGNSPVTVVAANYVQKTEDKEDGTYLVSMGTEKSSPHMGYRAAVVIDSAGALSDNSVAELVQGATAAKNGVDGATIQGTSDSLNGIINMGGSFTLSNSQITLDTKADGSNTNDFAGFGAGVATYGGKTVIKDSTVETTGVAKPAVFTDGGADLIVINSTLTAHGADAVYQGYTPTSATDEMVSPPWVLGVAGNARTSNLMGQKSTGTFVDSTITSDSWGALSVDSGSDIVMTTLNSTVTATNKTGTNASYGAFGIGATQEYMYGLDMDVDNYAWVLLGATVNLMSSETGKTYAIEKVDGTKVADVTSDQDGRNTTIDSGNMGFMMSAFGNATNTVNVTDKTEINTKNATFLYKSGGAAVKVEDSTVTSENGIFFQALDNEDAVIGDMTKGFVTPDGWSSGWYADKDYYQDYKSGGTTGAISIKNSTVNGSIYNGSGYYYTAGGMFSSEGVMGSHALSVTLDEGAVLNGAIASSEIKRTPAVIEYSYEKDGVYVVADATKAAMRLGVVDNQPYYNGYNDVDVVVKAGAKWNVTGNSMVTNLTADSAAVTADKAVTITVNGTLTLDGKAVTADTTVGNVTYKVKTVNTAPITRAELASLLCATAGGTATGTASSFTDVASSAAYAGAVNWAVEAGIFKGVGNNTFAPDQKLTLQELYVILYRYAGNLGVDTAADPNALSSFSDAGSVGAWAVDGAAWCAASGLVQGTALNPGSTVTAAEAEALISQVSALSK